MINRPSSKGKQLVMAGVLAGLDLLIKAWVRQNGIYQANYGGIFGLWPHGIWLLLLAGCWLLVLKEWQRQEDKYMGVWYGWILAGGLANIVDRAVNGFVTDFIYYPGVNLWGNLADIYLLIGVVGILGWSIKEARGREA